MKKEAILVTREPPPHLRLWVYEKEVGSLNIWRKVRKKSRKQYFKISFTLGPL